MIDLFGPVPQAYRAHVPPDQRKGIAIVGAGAIVNVAHLPKRRGGLRVVGITDLDHDRAVAERHGINRVNRDLEQLVATTSKWATRLYRRGCGPVPPAGCRTR
jgi:threonine dehydrogenase-like Zn-dependent dehydrogenase